MRTPFHLSCFFTTCQHARAPTSLLFYLMAADAVQQHALMSEGVGRASWRRGCTRRGGTLKNIKHRVINYCNDVEREGKSGRRTRRSSEHVPRRSSGCDGRGILLRQIYTSVTVSFSFRGFRGACRKTRCAEEVERSPQKKPSKHKKMQALAREIGGSGACVIVETAGKCQQMFCLFPA